MFSFSLYNEECDDFYFQWCDCKERSLKIRKYFSGKKKKKKCVEICLYMRYILRG